MAEVKIDTAVWDALRAKLGKAAEWYVKVGVLASAGGNVDVGGITLTDLAAVHEYGSPAAGVPQRSFIRSTFQRADVASQLEKLLGKLARNLIADKLEVDKALDQLGAWASNQIKLTIKNRLTTGPEPQANKPSTIAAKGSDLPLVDTGRLLNAVTWEKVK